MIHCVSSSCPRRNQPMNTFSNKRQSWSTHRSRLLEVGCVIGGSFPVLNASHGTAADKSQSDLQVISLLKWNIYFLREVRSGYSTASRGFETGGHSHATNHFLSANEMSGQPSPRKSRHCCGLFEGKKWRVGQQEIFRAKESSGPRLRPSYTSLRLTSSS